MSILIPRARPALVLLLATLIFASAATAADGDPLQLLVGRWDVRVETLRPQKAEVTYTEIYDWVLDGQFLRGRTEQKSDGSEDLVIGTYDEQAKGYPFWIFSSSGTYLYLPPATWDPRRRIMEWKNPPSSDIVYMTQVVFEEGSRRWTSIIKDWKGTVILEQEGRAVRRSD